MSRRFTLILLLVGTIAGFAFRSEDPFRHDRPFPFNTTMAHLFFDFERGAPSAPADNPASDADTLNSMRVTMLNYFAYDSAYASKVQRVIQRRMPSCLFNEFWDGSAEDLATTLSGQDVVVAAYPSSGTPESARIYGKVLSQFVKQGGTVVLTGTHEFGILQQLGLFDLDYGYYCKEKKVGQLQTDHVVFQGVGTEFTTEVYQYPLDISDPGFVTLAEVRGYPFMGYKVLGQGKVIYLGLEYYYDEPQSSRILLNALRWAVKPRIKRSEEVLYAGKGMEKANKVDLKVYPNPYVSKATLDIEIAKSTSVGVEMTDELGRLVAVLLPRRQLSAGLYRFELPNVPPGVYLVQCQFNEGNMTKKVVKTEEN